MSLRDSAAPIIVLGSANQDYIIRVAAPPTLGETVLATGLLKKPGGKGANQAVAAARLQGNVSFVACVGDDDDGALLIRELRSEGVDTTNVEMINRERTGLAIVTVFDSGDNSVIVVPGSNFALTAQRVRTTVSRLAVPGAVLVIQAELRADIIRTALETAEQAGIRSIFNLAPYQPTSAELLAICDPLVVNETEASALVGWQVRDVQSAATAVEQLRRAVRSVVITIGPGGACWADQESSGHLPAPIAPAVVDTTGAGDAFVGALATFLARGANVGEATAVGVRAGTYAVGSLGAQSSYPTRSDLGLAEVRERAGDSHAL